MPLDCENGVLDPGEECDDQGMVNGDGCSAQCIIEPGWRCEGEPSRCTRLPAVSVSGSHAAEGEALRFEVVISSSISADIHLDWVADSETAETPADYSPRTGTATITAGELTTVVEIATTDDLILEPPETVQLKLPRAVEPPTPIPTATGTIGPPRLTDRGAIVRYFLDELPSGEPVGNALDALRTPALDLTPTLSASGPFYETKDGGRGLAWTALGSSGSVGGPVGATKVAERLDGKQTFSVELLTDVVDASRDTHVLHLGPDDVLGGALAMILSNNDVTLIRDGKGGLAEWDTSVVGRGPVLVTITYDSTRSDPSDRVALYMDGELGPRQQFSPQPADALLVGPTGRIVIGNANRDPPRSIEGWIGYVALYDVELTPDEVKRNAHRILIDDDSR